MAKLMNEENDWDIRLMELDKEIGSGKQRRGLWQGYGRFALKTEWCYAS